MIKKKEKNQDKKYQFSLSTIQDIKSLEELAKFYDDLYNYAKGKFGESNFEDILQESFIKLDRAFKRGTPVNGGYIGLTMSSVSLDLKKKYSKIDLGTSLYEANIPEQIEDREDILDKILLEDKYTKLDAALNDLDFYDSKIIEYTNEMSFAELSRQTGIPKQSLSKRRNKIIEHLKTAILS